MIGKKASTPISVQEEQRAAEILGRVRRMEVRTNRLVDDSLAGRYASVFKGRGMDFDRVRNYVPGDDVRTIDWNVTARTGDPHVKLFTEERELTIMLVIDVSASSDFGSVVDSKRELAAEAAGVLAASAIRNRDKVGLILFSDEVELYIPPGKGRMHIMRLIRETLYFQPENRGTDISKALDFANQVIHRKSVFFLVSDFCLGAPFEERMNQLRNKLQVTSRRHDVIAVSVTDPREESLPDVGRICIEDAETGQVVEIDTGNPKVREAYETQSRQRRERTAARIRSLGIDLLQFYNGENWMPALMGFFQSRRQRTG
ncbi:DUF58 domain-containing protein [Luteolibacter yonseiensis]|uniref:DUF58 domain-containing protein n=1 Tax=Luteolibacter yonseiensis TaxID=1144680 RepID=A0A934R3M5_9BACT|nr:DUF58 domain-containing protein [Luteolibacter yonseiensis]MBK1816284.1 DUF58 domain-containing protein [Luteolibacter yonseiensis]